MCILVFVFARPFAFFLGLVSFFYLCAAAPTSIPADSAESTQGIEAPNLQNELAIHFISEQVHGENDVDMKVSQKFELHADKSSTGDNGLPDEQAAADDAKRL